MPHIERPHPARRRGAAVGLPWAALLGAACGGDAVRPSPECAGLEAAVSGTAVGLSLAPGDLCVLLAADAANLELAAAAGEAEYLIAVQGASRVPAATAGLRFEVEGIAPGPSVAVSRTPAPRATDPALLDLERASRAELRFRARAREALEGVRPLRPTAGPAGPSVLRSGTGSRLVPGDTVEIRNSVDTDLSVDCDGVAELSTVVRAAGTDFGILEDIEAAGAVGEGAYAELLATLEELVFPVDTAYFGAPADLDGNGVVWVLFTPVVNRVTPRGSQARVLGFFNPSDLSDPASCPASNRGEILYLLAADPDGRFGDPVGPAFVTSRAVGVVAHELEHLISAERRVTLGGGTFADLEDAWLSEGLAHSAETAVGFAAAGLRPGDDLGFGELAADRAGFDAFHFANFRRTGFYFRDPSGTLALGDESGEDPGGLSSLEMRGFAWLFLRWLADRAAPAGGVLGGPAEERLFRDLSDGGPARARGIANVERVAAALGAEDDWDDLLSAYALAPPAEGASGAAPASRIGTFDLTSIYFALHRELEAVDPFVQPYPLLVTSFDLGEATNAQVDFDLSASATRFFRLGAAVAGGSPPAASHPPMRLALGTPSGAPVPASARVRLILHRTR